MTTVHAQLIGGKAVLSRDEFECLVELARQSERIEVQVEEDDVPTAAIMRLAETGGAFDCLRLARTLEEERCGHAM
jgi:hypothetical protein